MPLILSLALAAGLTAQPIVPPKPAAEPLPPVAPEVLPSVDSVLTRLETADKDLTSLTAALRMIKRAPAIEGGGLQVRYGILKFTSGEGGADAQKKPLRRFAIDIDTVVVEGKVRDDKQSFVFDGHYLLETWPKQKQYVRRHIVGADQKKDPLRIGEGPFPIPVGQRKADLVARFNITVAPALDAAPESDQLRRILFKCIQLKLIPKEGTEQAKAFSEIRLWYGASDMLPVFALTQNVDGSANEVFLDDVKKNPPIPDAAFNTNPPSKSEGWTGEEQDLRDKATITPGDPIARPTPPSPAPNPSEPSPTQPK